MEMLSKIKQIFSAVRKWQPRDNQSSLFWFPLPLETEAQLLAARKPINYTSSPVVQHWTNISV